MRSSKLRVFLLGLQVLCLGGPSARAQTQIELISFTNVWKYESSGIDLGTTWRETDFDDSSWASGVGPLGFGIFPLTVPIATQLNRTAPSNGQSVITYYFRSAFHFDDMPARVQLLLTNQFDDGAIVYLNNQEVYRSGMSSAPVTYSSFASANIFIASLQAATNIIWEGLRVGENVVAVEVHKFTALDSDLVMGLTLSALPLAATPLTITNEPSDTMLEEAHSVVLSVGVSGYSPRYQWFKDGLPIQGATASSLIFEAAVISDTGLYHVQITNQIGSVTSRVAQVVVRVDTQPPSLLSADGTINTTTIRAIFSEDLLPEAATNVNSYMVTNTLGGILGLESAVLVNGTNVLLTTSSERLPDLNYLLIVRNLVDHAVGSNVLGVAIEPITWRRVIIATNAMWSFYDPLPGLNPLFPGSNWIHPEFDDTLIWGVGRAAFSYGFEDDVLPFEQRTVLSQGATTKYFRTLFDYHSLAASAEFRLRHLIDDGAIFYLNGEEIYRYRLPPGSITEYTAGEIVGTPSLVEVSLPAEKIRKGDNLMAVELHGRSPIDLDWIFGAELYEVVTSSTVGPVFLVGGPESRTVSEYDLVTFQVSSVGARAYQWYRNEAAIPGATNGTYTIDKVSVLDHNARFHLRTLGASPGEFLVSTNAVLQVIPDTKAPTLQSIVAEGSNIFVTFSEDIDMATGSSLANYVVTNRLGLVQTISSIAVSNNVAILTMTQWARPGDAVIINYVKDSSDRGNLIAAHSGATVGFKGALIPMDAVWKYDQSVTDWGTNWSQVTFDDSAWPSGPALLAFENAVLSEPIRTALADPRPRVTFYFRTRFNSAGADTTHLQLSHYVDDGAIYYLNGVEFYRIRMGAFGPSVTYTTLADPVGVGNAVLEGPFTVAVPTLQEGANVLAVEVHQQAPSSADIVFGTSLLTGEVPSAVFPPRPCVDPGGIKIVRDDLNQATITWGIPCFTLQKALTLAGPWTEVVGAISPHVITGTESGFYRLYAP